jgi:DNA-binding IscR family transcriptional regulator
MKTMDYSIRAIRYLGERNAKVSCREICVDLGMPERYILQVLRRLVLANILEASRGCNGGYEIVNHDVTLSDINSAFGHSYPECVSNAANHALGQVRILEPNKK